MQRFTAILRAINGTTTRAAFDCYGTPTDADARRAAGPRWARAEVLSIVPMVRA